MSGAVFKIGAGTSVPSETTSSNPAWEVMAGNSFSKPAVEEKEIESSGGGLIEVLNQISDGSNYPSDPSSYTSDLLALGLDLETVTAPAPAKDPIAATPAALAAAMEAAAAESAAAVAALEAAASSVVDESAADMEASAEKVAASNAAMEAAMQAASATNNPLKLADWTKIPDAEKWKTDSAARYPAVGAAGKLAIDMEYDVLMKLLENSDEFRKIFRTIHEKGFIDFIEKKNKAVPNTFSLDEANKRVTQLLAASIDEDITIPLGYTFHINDGKTLSINSGKTLTNDGTIDNHGLVDIAGMQEISNDIITNIKNFGTLINNNVFKSLNKTNNKGKIVNKKDFYITDEDKSDNKKKWRNGELYIKGQPMKDDYINLDNKGIIENKKGTMHVEGMLSNSHNIKNEIGAKFNVGKESTRTTNKEHNTTITGIYSKEKSTFDNFGTFNAGGKDLNSTDTTSDFHPVKMWGDAQAKFYNHSTVAGGGKINKGANMSDFVKIINSVGQENIKNFTNLKDLFAKA